MRLGKGTIAFKSKERGSAIRKERMLPDYLFKENDNAELSKPCSSGRSEPN